jgi:hypothetical protein
MDSGLETALVSASIAAVVSLSVAFFSPMLTHHLWKRQKRKEQQLSVAQRYAYVFAERVAFGRFDMSDSSWSAADDARFETVKVEFHGILYSVQVLFDSEVIRKRAQDLMLTERISMLECAELQAFLFAEALDISTKKIPTMGRRPERPNP